MGKMNIDEKRARNSPEVATGADSESDYYCAIA